MARDYRVRIRRSETIAEKAMAWWKVANRRGYSFDICDLVLGPLRNSLGSSFQVEIYSQAGLEDEPAYVTFDPLVLHVDRKVWEDAKEGRAYARYIVAHEIGHLVMHKNEYASPFSDEEAAQLKYVQNEESAEWQANEFAGYLLVPDHVALKLHDPDVIAGLCVVNDKLAAKRLCGATNAKAIIRLTYEGEMCSICGNFTLLREGTRVRCDTCGSTVACL